MKNYKIEIRKDLEEIVEVYTLKAAHEDMANHVVHQHVVATYENLFQIDWRITEIKDSHDSVNHPTHYTLSKAKCGCGKQIEQIEISRHMPNNLGNVIKYVWRHDHKNGLEDLKKAAWYLNDEIKRREGLQND